MDDEARKRKAQPDWVEEMEAAGGELLERVKALADAGNARRLIIRNAKGEVLIETPLTPAVLVGGAATLFHPTLAALGGMAALIAKLKVEIERVDTIDEGAETIEISLDDVEDMRSED